MCYVLVASSAAAVVRLVSSQTCFDFARRLYFETVPVPTCIESCPLVQLHNFLKAWDIYIQTHLDFN